MTTKMKAVICTAYGAPHVLQLKEVDKPVPAEDEVLVKIVNTAVTASDCAIRGLEAPGGYSFPLRQMIRLAMRLALGFSKPRNPILGLVFSGVVESVGAQVKTFERGDEVFGFTGNSRGTYADYKLVSTQEIEAGEVFLTPQNATHEETAAIAYGGVLALHFMRTANIGPGDKVLIYGASGAIGTMAVQLAKQNKAEVTAVCSAKHFPLMAQLKADKMLDYTREDSIYQLDQYDFILDAVGKNKGSQLKTACQTALTPDGTYASVDDGLLQVKPEYLPKLFSLYEAGQLQAVIDKTYPLEEIVAAHTYVDQGHKKGNVIIQMS